MTCTNRDCPDCYPEHWQPEDDSHHAWAWPYAVALLALLMALALVYVHGAP